MRSQKRGRGCDDLEIAKKDTCLNSLMDQCMKVLIEKRLYGASYQKTKESTDYVKWREETTSLSKRIISKAGPDAKIFMRYEELSSLKEDALLQNAYEQGINDGIEISLRFLKH